MRKVMEPLEEKLVKATKVELGRLSRQITGDPELNRMLTTPMEKIPQYRYLYSSEMSGLGQQSLFDAIQFMLEYEHRANIYFSKVGYEFTGFVVYEDTGRIINSVKMASFKDDQSQTNPVLAKDLIELVLDSALKRDIIEWYVDPQNAKAIRQYDTLLNRKKLNWKKTKDGKMIKYIVQGYK